MAADHNGDVIAKRQALTTVRFVWAAMLVALLAFFVFVLVWGQALVQTGKPVGAPLKVIFFAVAIGMLVVCLPVGYFIRGQIYKRCWRGDAILPGGYMIGNLLLFACCQGVALFGLICMLLTNSLWPHILPTALATAVFVLNFPHGKPMEPDHGAAQHLPSES